MQTRKGAKVQRCKGSKVQRCKGVKVKGTKVQRYKGAKLTAKKNETDKQRDKQASKLLELLVADKNHPPFP